MPALCPPGNEDVSKEIEDEEQVLGLQGEEDGPPPPPDPNGQKQDEGLEMQVRNSLTSTSGITCTPTSSRLTTCPTRPPE